MPDRELFWKPVTDEAERVKRVEAALNHVVAQRSKAERRASDAPRLTEGEIWTLTEEERDLLTVWILGDAARIVLADVTVNGTATVTPDLIWEELRRLGSVRGWTGSLNFTVFPGDDLLAGVADLSGAKRVATKMMVDAAAVRPAERVTLQPMTDDEFARYSDGLAESFAQELVESGSADSLEAAREQSSQQLTTLLPDGLNSPGNRLWIVRDGDERVGILWIHLGENRAFIYDIEMEPEARGRGYGTQTLRLAAQEARSAGLPTVALNVFGNNEGAARLYAREGYVTTETLWSVPAAPQE